MRIYINLFFLLLIFLTACGKKKAPSDILNAGDMAEVLTDVHLVDGSLNNISPVPDTVYKYGLGRYLMVFRQHHTDTVQFKKSMQYYSEHPDQLDDIYTQVIQNLQTKLDQLNKTPAPQNALPAK